MRTDLETVDAPDPVLITTIGAAFSANKGAASMLQALFQGLACDDAMRFVAVSTHPAADRAAYRRAGLDVEVADQRPLPMVASHLPLALLAGLLRSVRLPWRWLCRPRALRSLADADVVADLSGISFVDGRRFPLLVYNALLVAIPLLLGRPIIKCSQALGPFRRWPNRVAASLLLPRLHTVCPRGAASERHVRELGLTRVCPAADLAFLMSVDDDVRARMVRRLSSAAPGPYLAVAPSQVVETYCRKAGIDYVGAMARFIEDARDRTGHTVVMLAHSAEAGAGVSHMNDLPLCRGIHERIASTEGIVLFDEDLLPGELRALIGASAVLVTSRFHGMISALTERVPVLVIGWSHKYAEVLEPFGLADFALPYSTLGESPDLMDLLRATLAAREDIAREIAQRLPEAVASAGENVRVLREAVSAPALVS